MQEEDIKHYLKNEPLFFERNAAFLAEIHLPSPHGQGTISLAERQQLAQRDKISVIEQRFAELVENAQANDAINNKVHLLNIELHQAKNFDEIEQLISDYLPEHFDLSETCLRLWAAPVGGSTGANLVFSPVSETTKTWLAALKQPYCGAPPEIVEDTWLIEPATSLAIMPLRAGQIFGLLAFASQDETRFSSEDGTDFLTKISEIISAALSRVLTIPNNQESVG